MRSFCLAGYFLKRTRASLRRSAVNATPAPIKIRASVALKLPGAMQSIQVPMIVGASNIVRSSLCLVVRWPTIGRSQSTFRARFAVSFRLVAFHHFPSQCHAGMPPGRLRRNDQTIWRRRRHARSRHTIEHEADKLATLFGRVDGLSERAPAPTTANSLNILLNGRWHDWRRQ
jgi:hypothetical protein